MDDNLYDEFGNYIGPELDEESYEEEAEEQVSRMDEEEPIEDQDQEEKARVEGMMSIFLYPFIQFFF